MPTPQLEDGYTSISNELLDALIKIRINGEAMQIYLFILRKTYGYHKKMDRISLSQMVFATSINKPNVIRGIHKLMRMKMIIQKDNDNSKAYSIQKDYGLWKSLSKKIPPLSKKITPVIQKDNRSLSKKITPVIQKDNVQKIIIQKKSITKDTSTKDSCNSKNELQRAEKKSAKNSKNIKTFSTDAWPYKLSKYLYDCICCNDPHPKCTEKDIPKWAIEIDLLIRLDKRDPKEIGHVIEWVQNDDFNKSKVLSARKLRLRYPQLRGDYLRSKPKQRHAGAIEYLRKHGALDDE